VPVPRLYARYQIDAGFEDLVGMGSRVPVDAEGIAI
jgi:hypothetical protein